ncbi:MAG: acetate--CoA ligase family protein [Deltaproteobacteria bacterium]|nr:acetate--CoA ligase family protein [Deltaproteobacteria bacterium]
MQDTRKIIHEARKQGQDSLSEYHSKQVLNHYGIPTVQETLVRDLDAAREAAEKIGYPVVLKVCSPEVTHKTEKGLIEVDLRDAEDLTQAFQRLQGKDATGDFLVQAMVKGPRELVAGMVRDAQFGPCVMLGLGGIFTETLNDVSFRVAPIEKRDVLEMVEELRGKKILEAIRGMDAVSMDVLVQTLVALGKIGLEHPHIREIDINPLIVQGSRPVAVDALVVLGEPPEEQPETTFQPQQLETFFSPESVVVIGASSAEGKPGNDVIRNMMDNGYKGDIHLVNPKGGEILGIQVKPSIDDLPPGIELAIIILPAKLNPQTIRDCAAKGVKAVVLAAGGFAEVDEEGESLQEDLKRAIKETGVRVIGPNTSGHTSTPHNFTSSFFPLGKIPRGNISYIAQTGNFATHTMRYIATAEHFGVARVVGMGNKVDVEECEVLQYCADDPETKAIFMYLESFKNPRRFLEVAREVTKVKPVILLKGGRTSTGAKAAVAHTAALASDHRITEGALKQAGIVPIYHYSHLFMAAKVLSSMPLPKGNRVSMLGPSGAMLVVLSDFCKQSGLDVPKLEESSRERLQEISPPFLRMRNPVDIWGSATVHSVEFGYREGMEAVLKDPNIDAVVPILLLTDRSGIPSYDFIVDLAERYPEKPILVTFSGEIKHYENAKAFLEPRGVPTFPLIEEPFEVLSILAQCRKAMERE